jgi:hypothetical protein
MTVAGCWTRLGVRLSERALYDALINVGRYETEEG